jgi:predicted ferric reductase
MIWRGQLKAIMGIVVVLGLVISVVIYNATDSVWPFFVLVILVPVVGLGFGILNTLSTAVRGKPLAYDVKIFDERSSSPNVSMPMGSSPGVSASSPGGFCTNCGRPRNVAARFCTNCGAQHAPSAYM